MAKTDDVATGGRTSNPVPGVVGAALFPRTAQALAADRSFRVVALAVLGAAALGAWALWAARGRVEVAVVRGRAIAAPGADTARPGRASFPPAARYELETASLADWLLGGRRRESPERSPSP